MATTSDKIKHALHMDKNTSTTHSTATHGNNVPEGTTGPHNSRVANAADPRVDSDMDGSNRHNTTHTGTTGTGVGHSTHGHSATGAGYGSTGPAAGTAGPHSSNLLNKADPTVDSDLDGGRHMGAKSDARTAGHTATGTTGAGYGTTGTHTGTHTGTTGTGFGTSGTHTGTHTGATGAGYGTTGTGHSTTTAGPHSSNLLNKADPRVDSDRDGSHNIGTSNGHSTHTGAGAYSTPHTGTGTHGGISHSTNAGPHDSNLANKADPRVDSNLDGRGGQVGHSHGGITGASGSHATPGSGTAQNTAGPHNSDLLNKLDPRVDSDLSGGKTYLGNKTHQ